MSEMIERISKGMKDVPTLRKGENWELYARSFVAKLMVVIVRIHKKQVDTTISKTSRYDAAGIGKLIFFLFLMLIILYS